MTTQTMYAHDDGLKHGVADSMSYPPEPGSPTLTNPDMILPDYERADSPDDLPQSLWNNQPTATLRNHMLPPESFVAGPMTPTTPIIYGNGTMLSDIGEVTEVESNAGAAAYRRTSSRYSDQSVEEVAVRSSPIVGNSLAQRLPQKVAHERRSSIDSTSTIKSNSRAPFADFDDAVSVDDSVFQGDDEESMASSWIDDNPVQGRVAVQQPIVHQVAEETYSTNTLSQRAEQILANAKRRLTTMEGNLTRARSSLSYSSMSNGSTPSPPLTRPRTALHESVTSPVTSFHVRNKSDDGLHAAIPPTSFPQRSASALGAAGGYRKPSSARREDATGTGGLRGHHMVSHYPLDTALEPLGEDDGASIDGGLRDSGQYSTSGTPTFSKFSDKHLNRSASAAQVREIQDQMQGLKGKISTLKEQARADSLKRRSLQSLRTPSPFTHARWDHGFGGSSGTNDSEPPSPALHEYEDDENTPTETVPPELPLQDAMKTEAPTMLDDRQQILSPQEDRSSSPAEFPIVITPNFEDAVPSDPSPKGVQQEKGDDVESDVHDASGEDGSGRADSQTIPDRPVPESEASEEILEGTPSEYDSDAGESQYHDSFQHPVSHEDREDAFDYEHFFLHSAMGNLRHTRRDSVSSTESNESAETARGPDRRSSIDTTASAESFRTADEDYASRTSLSNDEPPKAQEPVQRSVLHRPHHSAYSGFRFGNDSSERPENRTRTNSVIHRPASAAPGASMHRPSISSFESTGTTRSFPLVNKARLNGGILTPMASPDQASKHNPETLSLADTASLRGSGFPSTVQMLAKEDQVLVEGLIAGLGQCVLKLSEGSRASTEGRLNLRRLEAARRILEGIDEV